MFKMKVIMASLAVIGSAGLINCSEFQGSHSIPEGGPELNSEQVEKEALSPEEAQALAMQQRRERRASIQADLQNMANRSYPETECSPQDQQALANQNEVVDTGSRILTLNPPLQDILNTQSEETRVENAAVSLGRILRNADNTFCAVNVAAETAARTISLYITNPINDTMRTIEYEALIDKAEHVRNALAPVVSDLQDTINAEVRAPFMAQVERHNEVSSELSSSIQNIGQMVERIKASSQCQQTGACTQEEIANGLAIVRAENAVNQAQAAIERHGISGPNDQDLAAKNTVLEDHAQLLAEQINSLQLVVTGIEQGLPTAGATVGATVEPPSTSVEVTEQEETETRGARARRHNRQ
jgi:hypothetical protein